MAKCKECKYYKENPNFDYYDTSKGAYAECEIGSIEFSGLDGVLQETLGYKINCDWFEKKNT